MEPITNQTDMYVKPDQSGKATASLVLGLVSILGIVLWYIGIITSIIGLVMGVKGLKSSKRNLAIAGTVLSCVFLVASIAIGVISIIYLSEHWGEIMDAANKAANK